MLVKFSSVTPLLPNTDLCEYHNFWVWAKSKVQQALRFNAAAIYHHSALHATLRCRTMRTEKF